MKASLIGAAGLIAAPAFVRSSAASQHPIEQVIELLKGLASTAESEGKTEALAYEKFEYWCKNTLKELAKAIAEETSAIEVLEDKIASAEEQETDLQNGIAQLQVQLGELDTSAATALSRRQDTLALYNTTSSDLSDTITAVDSALTALQATASGSASLMQVVSSPVVQKALEIAEVAAPVNLQSKLSALIQQPDFKERPDFEAEGDRAAHVQKYEFKSGDIIETLKTLKTQFEDELLAATKGETDSINSYNLAKQERDHVHATATADLAVKQGALSDVQLDLTNFKASLSSEQNDKATDKGSQQETDKACMVKKQEWEQRSSVRRNEIEAIGAAIKILAEATQVRTEAPGNPVPPPSPAASSLLQLSFLQVSDPRAKAVNLLRSRAHKMHSRTLERLAQQLSSHLDDPFEVVINNIEKMIFHLMDEQRQEDEHKAWCDQELSHNNASKVDKEDKINELTLKIESADAFVVELSSEIGAAQSHIAEIVAWMKEATEIRDIGKKENALAIADAQKAQAAVADATATIVSFYKESGMIAKESWEAFVQKQPVTLSDKPSTWGSSYTGVAQPENQPDGIVTVLKQVGADFATMEADTRAQDAADQAQFEEDIKENKIAKAGREQEVETKNAEKNRQTDIIGSLTAARKHTSDELEQVNQYLHDLIPACVAGDSTYEERKQARTDEAEALRQAQSILTDAFKEAGSPAPAPAGATNFLRATVHRHA